MTVLECREIALTLKEWIAEGLTRSGLTQTAVVSKVNTYLEEHDIRDEEGKLKSFSSSYLQKMKSDRADRPDIDLVIAIGEVFAENIEEFRENRVLAVEYINGILESLRYLPIAYPGEEKHSSSTVIRKLDTLARTVQETLRELSGANPLPPLTEEEGFFYDALSRIGTYQRMDNISYGNIDVATAARAERGEEIVVEAAGTLADIYGDNTALVEVLSDALEPHYHIHQRILVKYLPIPAEPYLTKRYLYLYQGEVRCDRIAGRNFRKNTYEFESGTEISLSEARIIGVVLATINEED